MLCTASQQFEDWSAPYRLFERERFDKNTLMEPVKKHVLDQGAKEAPLVVMMDDTLIHKRGRKVAGTSWRRDPLGPKFCSSFIWAQRFLQISAALPETGMPGRARAIPLELVHAPTPRKPSAKAPQEQWDTYQQERQRLKISAVGKNRLDALRQWMDNSVSGREKPLVIAVDGGYTNRTIFRNIPHTSTIIGRIRKDARLFHPPEQPSRRGRPRWFGTPTSTPEEIRKDETIPWVSVNAYGAGRMHSFEVKTIAPLRWLGTGARDVRIIIIRPLAYRPKKGARLLYREPGYLICTDPTMSLE
jgi:hypothetical protein